MAFEYVKKVQTIPSRASDFCYKDLRVVHIGLLWPREFLVLSIWKASDKPFI